MNPDKIITEFYQPGTRLYDIFMRHGEAVAKKAVTTAENLPHLSPDIEFIRQAAWLHDIGIFLTRAKNIGCHGDAPYICHGVRGRQLLDERGYPAHGLVCERHVGTGIRKNDILSRNLPLPLRDMRPVSIEEKIICYADKFFSKKRGSRPKPIEAIITSLSSYGEDKVQTFLAWADQFDGIKKPQL
ncbi:MAG: phosphohydrolase [Deltaproteobacteria bacterium]|nr:MAG: phosphohydrolase [Deltaproteobacteria bacterium]